MRSALNSILYVIGIACLVLLVRAPVSAPKVDAVTDYLRQHLIIAVVLCWVFGFAFVALFVSTRQETEKYWSEFKQCLLSSFFKFAFGFLIVAGLLALAGLIEWGISRLLH